MQRRGVGVAPETLQRMMSVEPLASEAGIDRLDGTDRDRAPRHGR